ncbi:penicillin-binding protein [Croceivirga thetidis]|nr:penicillin-binding protein [Croceivirga thetidis]
MSRLYLIVVGMVIFAGLVAFKLIGVSTVEGEKYKQWALEKTERVATIPPIRGNIFSDDGSLLAASVAKYTVHLDALTPKSKLWEDEHKALCDSLGTLFGKPSSHYLQKLRKARANKKRHVLLARDIDYPEFARMRNFPLLKYHPYKGGMKSDYKVVREYPLGQMAWRSIGYEKVDENGYYTRVGIDGAFGKDFLRGVVGKRMEQKSGGGQWKPMGANNIVEPQDGLDVLTTLNINFQDIAHNELKKQLQAYDADHGCVVVMEVETGAVKAIANLGKDEDGNYIELRNYAVWEAHEPGSTFKLMSLLAALEDNVADTTQILDTHKGRWKVYNKLVKDSRWGGYGQISIAKGFAVSSNTVFAQMINNGYEDQPEKFVNRLMNFGLHKKLDLPIIGEGQPIIRYPGDKLWSGLSLAWMSQGYEVALTPLQTLTFYNAIANDGEMVRPRFLSKARVGNREVEKFEKEVMSKSIASTENIKKVQRLLKDVVEKDFGTGSGLYDPNFSMAGKTGTSWKNYWANADDRDYISSFAGYFPADDPKYSCIVIIHEPNQEKGIYGADVAGPVFKSMAKKIYLSSPVIDKVEVDIPENEELNKKYEDYYAKAQEETKKMPNLLGMSGMDAVSLLENLGVEVALQSNGKVVEQSVEKGTALNEVKKITLTLQ